MVSRDDLTVGGLLGYSSVNSIVNLKVPSSNGVSCGPKMTAFHNMMLLSLGAPDTPSDNDQRYFINTFILPAGGSCCNLLKSLISLRLAGVDILGLLELNLTKTIL